MGMNASLKELTNNFKQFRIMASTHWVLLGEVICTLVTRKVLKLN